MDSPSDNPTQKIADLLPPVVKAIMGVVGIAWAALKYGRKYRSEIEAQSNKESRALASIYVAGIEKSQDHTEIRIQGLEARVRELEAALRNATEAGRVRQEQYLEENTALKIRVAELTSKIEILEGRWEGGSS